MCLYVPVNYREILVGVVPGNTSKKNVYFFEANTLIELQLENRALLLKNHR
jgi:hypothetical protein